MRSRPSTFVIAIAAAVMTVGMSGFTSAAGAAGTAASHHTRSTDKISATSGPQVAGAARPALQASSVSLPAPVSQTPIVNTPNIYAGSSCGQPCKAPGSTVYDSVFVDGELVIGGAFTAVCAPAPASYAQCPSTVPVSFIFAFDPATGAIDPNFKPILDQGPVYSLAAGPNDTVYVGGGFTTVNGTAAGGLAQLYVTPSNATTDGQLVPGFAGQTDGTVLTMAVNGNALYVGGEFAHVDGKPEKVARLNATTGALDTTFSMTLSDPVTGFTLKVKKMALTADGTLLGIVGTFLDVNGMSRPRLALIDTGGGLGQTATLADWTAPILANNCSKQHDYINGIDFSPDGSFFVVDGTGYEPAGGVPGLCDAAARFPVNATGNVSPTWINYSGGDTFHSIVITGPVVYLGGHNRWANNECGNNKVCESNAVLEDGLSALDANTGLALPWWHPQTARGVGVESLVAYPAGSFSDSDGGLIVGTNVSSIGGQTHAEMAMFPMTTTTSPTPGGPIPSGIFSQGRLNTLEEQGAGKGIAAMCLDDAGNSTTSGSPVELVTCQNDNEQNWTIEPGGQIEVNGLCLDTAGEVATPGTKVVVSTCSTTGAPSQDWTQGTGNTLLNHAGTSICLDDAGNSTTNGVQLDVATCSGSAGQVWPLPVAQAPPPPPPAGPVYPDITQPKSDVPCLTDLDSLIKAGAPITMSVCLGKSTQTWTAEPDGTIQFRGHCLDTQGGALTANTPVVLDPCNGSPSQIWTRQPGGLLEDSSNPPPGLCLDDQNPANGTQPEIEPCNAGTVNEQWQLPTY